MAMRITNLKNRWYMCVSKFAELVLSVVVEHDPVTADIAIATKKERKHKHEQIRITIKCLIQHDAISAFDEVAISCILLHSCCNTIYYFTRKQLYTRSQNNVNLVFCNCKEITSCYSAITKCSLLHNWPNLGSIVKMFVWNFEEACDM